MGSTAFFGITHELCYTISTNFYVISVIGFKSLHFFLLFMSSMVLFQLTFM